MSQQSANQRAAELAKLAPPRRDDDGVSLVGAVILVYFIGIIVGLAIGAALWKH